ncbi:MAG: hypothetical protein H6707_21320 [Deltaproteobacteria bacterium]|nr:hypothetical protein [Deltaproteobacteria bacterium]
MSAPSEKCPSRFQLDRFAHGEIAEDKRTELQPHLDQCSRCTEWIEQIKAKEELLRRQVDSDQFAEKVMRRRAKSKQSPSDAAHGFHPLLEWLRGHWVPIASTAAACLILVVVGVSLSRHAPIPTVMDTAIKGTSSVKIHCLRQGKVFELEPGSPIQQGDALRFEAFTEKNRYLLVLSVQADGQVEVYVPFDGKQSLKITEGKKQLLEGSVIMGDSNQDELLVFLFSKVPIVAASAQDRAKQAYARAKRRLPGISRLGINAEQHTRLLVRKRSSE